MENIEGNERERTQVMKKDTVESREEEEERKDSQ